MGDVASLNNCSHHVSCLWKADMSEVECVLADYSAWHSSFLLAGRFELLFLFYMDNHSNFWSPSCSLKWYSSWRASSLWKGTYKEARACSRILSYLSDHIPAEVWATKSCNTHKSVLLNLKVGRSKTFLLPKSLSKAEEAMKREILCWSPESCLFEQIMHYTGCWRIPINTFSLEQGWLTGTSNHQNI